MNKSYGNSSVVSKPWQGPSSGRKTLHVSSCPLAPAYLGEGAGPVQGTWTLTRTGPFGHLSEWPQM